MRNRKPMTDGQQFAYEIICYLKAMYPEMMSQSKSFNTSLRNKIAIQYDSWEQQRVNPPVRQARSPIEMLVDQACGFMEPPKKNAK